MGKTGQGGLSIDGVHKELYAIPTGTTLYSMYACKTAKGDELALIETLEASCETPLCRRGHKQRGHHELVRRHIVSCQVSAYRGGLTLGARLHVDARLQRQRRLGKEGGCQGCTTE